MLFICVSVSK